MVSLQALPQGIGSQPQELVLALNDRLRRISAALPDPVAASTTTTPAATTTETAGYVAIGDGTEFVAKQPRGNSLVAQLADTTTNPATGNLAAFDAHGNITDGGAPSSGGASVFFNGTTRVASHTATGTAGQIGYDAAAYFYFCYATNLWVRIGASGYTMGF